MRSSNHLNLDIKSGSKITSLETGNIPDTPLETIKQYLQELKDHQLEWAQLTPISERIKLLEEVLSNIDKYSDEWIQLDLAARKVPKGHWGEHESAPLGPIGSKLLVLDYLLTLKKLEQHGGNKPFAKARQDGDRVIVDSFPRSEEDEKRLPGVRAEIHLMEGTRVEDLPKLQAKNYKDPAYKGGVALVLGAGNVAHLTIRDLFHKLLEEKKVVIIKSNPVIEYMGPLLEKVLKPFIERGFIRIVVGGTKEGTLLVNHPLVDEIIMTGSDKTFEAIVYGGGPDGQKNKANDKRAINKPVAGELGSVSPVIVVPGNWADEDFEHYSELLLHMIIINSGYACLATRIVVLPKNWEGSKKLMSMLIDKMSKTPLAVKFYPGTNQTVQDAMACYPDAIKFGELGENSQPIIFANNLDPNKDEVAYTREFWMTFSAQVALEGDTKEEFLKNAVEFANKKLWGTLVATLFIDPKSQQELEESGAFKKAIDNLRYGNVTINTFPVITALAGNNSEGGYPGSTYNNIQSGNATVRNSLMLDKIEKTVFFAPFR